MRTFLLLFAALLALSCKPIPTSHEKTVVRVANEAEDTTVFVAFGADSKLTADDWASFCSGGGLACSFALAKNGRMALPNPTGKYLNATFSFGAPVGCGITKAEVNVNNPSWYDILDVSLVDGYSNKVQITATPTGQKAVELGPPAGAEGNENVMGVFPLGCDICVERQNPPCGIEKGKEGCHAGTQYNPTPVCQWQGKTMGGGGLSVEIALVAPGDAGP